MAVVDDDGPPPPELRLVWMCAKYHCLPDVGGLMDQDWRTLHRMTVFENVYNAQSRLRSAKGAEIHNIPAHDMEIIAWLRKNGLGVGMKMSGV